MKINEFTFDAMKQADIYKTKPYTMDKQFFTAYKKPPLFHKDKYEEEVKNLIYSYAYFVKANLGTGTVLVIEDEAVRTDIDKITEVANQLLSAASDPSLYSSSTQEFIKNFQKDNIGFDTLVPTELCGNITAHVCPVIFSYDDMPYKQVPTHRFMPCFLLPHEVKNMKYMIVNLIPKKFYVL